MSRLGPGPRRRWNGGSIQGRDKTYVSSKLSSLALVSDWYTTQRLTWMLYPGVKWRGREADYSLPSGADFKNERSCTSLPTVPSYSVQEDFFVWVNKTLRRCSWLTHCVTRREVPSSIADVVFGKFSSAQFVLSAFSSPRIHSASNTHEYQGISFGVKYGRRVEMTPLPS